MWLLANTKNGTSSHELGRALGVTQKTALFMLHRVRESMKDENPPMLAGEVEADETFVGGKHQHLPTCLNAVRKNVPIGGPAAGKTTVFGIDPSTISSTRSSAFFKSSFVLENTLREVLESFHRGFSVMLIHLCRRLPPHYLRREGIARG
jgi:hypothetical protein